jgi:hypothetical protein
MADAAMIAKEGSKFAFPNLVSWWGSKQAANAQKRAGTTLANAALTEEERARERERQLNEFLSTATSEQIAQFLQTADTAAGGIEGAAQRGVGYLDPYMQAGGRSATTLADLVNAPEERFAFQFSEDDPSYQFRLGEGQKALERSAAARGTLLGGGTLKALTNYGQKAASQEYQSAYDRAMSAFKANQTGRQNRMATLADLARIGSGAGEAAGRFGLTGAETAGRFRTGAAQTAGQWGIDSANKQAGISIGAEDIARQARLGRAQATAASQQATGNVWANFWSNLGQTGSDAFSQYMANQSGRAGAPGQSTSTGAGTGRYNEGYW